MEKYLFAFAALAYTVCAFLPAGRASLAPYISTFTTLAWLAHGYGLFLATITPGALRLGFAVIGSFALWISVLVYWLENRSFALDSLRVLLLPCAAVAVVLPVVFPGALFELEAKSVLFPAHVVIALLAYSTLTIAAFHAVVMALQESRLHLRSLPKVGWFSATIDRLPALMTMERILFRLISIGFVLLSLTVLSGIVFSELIFGQPLRWDHKTIFTLFSWLLFGVLLVGRTLRGWRGKTALSFTLIGFATLLLAYVGSRFVLEVLLQRVPA